MGLANSRNHSGAHSDDLRSGSPGQISTATFASPINGYGYLIRSVSVAFRYTTGYTLPNRTAPTVELLLVDALNGSEVASLWTSPPLGNYSWDQFKGYSPPVLGEAKGLAVAWPRSLRAALRVTNHGRNLQMPLESISLNLSWSSARQPGPFAPSDLSTPATDAVSVVRGPLLFALPLEPSSQTLHMPASGGECEVPGSSTCRSSDLAFHRSPNVTWNLALVRTPVAEASLTLHRRGVAPRPFDPAAPALTIGATVDGGHFGSVTPRPWLTTARALISAGPAGQGVEHSAAGRLCRAAAALADRLHRLRRCLR